MDSIECTISEHTRYICFPPTQRNSVSAARNRHITIKQGNETSTRVHFSFYALLSRLPLLRALLRVPSEPQGCGSC